MKFNGCRRMVRLSAVACLCAATGGTLQADVVKTGDPIALDGRLDESIWKAATWESGFSKFRKVLVDRALGAQTQFAVVADATAFYVGVRCEEPEMASLHARKPASLWGTDALELFVAPTGKSFDFYHFVIGYKKENGRYSSFASEGGTIHPDPYRPDWDFAVADCEGGWSAEIKLPFSALYMTRNATWESTWLFNLGRTRNLASGGTEYSTWSSLQNGYVEPNNFRTLSGFPKRRAEDDVAMLGATVDISRKRADGTLMGQAAVNVKVLKGGEYELRSPNLKTTAATLVSGDNRMIADCTFAGNGRHFVRLELTRKATGEKYVRDYPVFVDYEEIRVKLASPEYRNNFYPGQDASRVIGTVKTAVDGPVVVALEGPGFARCEKTLPEGGGTIDFDTTGFTEGDAFLTVTAAGVTKKTKIRRLAPSRHTMAWISDGNLIVNGKAVFRRNVYALGYHGGQAFDEKFASDADLHLTPEIESGGTLEAERVIPGLERKEAIRDVRPCQAYFDKIDALIERNRDKDFVYYYLSDEPECRGISPVYLKHIYDYVTEKDPYHVLLSASRGGPRYMECADWFETHPYLNPHDDGHGNRCYGVEPKDMGRYLDDIGVSDRPDKCIGFLPTLFAYRFQSLLNDYPTFGEYVCHAWAAILHGAKSLFPYAYHDMGDRAALYEGNRYLFSSCDRLSDFLLHGTRTWLVKTDVAKAVRYDREDKSMFVLVNLTREPQTVSLDGLKGRYREFRGNRTFGSSAAQPVTFDLQPQEVIIGTTEACDKGLSTFAETQAKVDRQEYARTHRDNQLLEKYMKVGFRTVRGKASFKMIDGVRDMYAWATPRGNEERWVEMELDGWRARFDRVRIFGFGILAAKAFVREGDGWRELPTIGETDGRFFKELQFAEPVETDRLRLVFPKPASQKSGEPLELYEIELPALK